MITRPRPRSCRVRSGAVCRPHSPARCDSLPRYRERRCARRSRRSSGADPSRPVRSTRSRSAALRGRRRCPSSPRHAPARTGWSARSTLSKRTSCSASSRRPVGSRPPVLRPTPASWCRGGDATAAASDAVTRAVDFGVTVHRSRLVPASASRLGASVGRGGERIAAARQRALPVQDLGHAEGVGQRHGHHVGTRWLRAPHHPQRAPHLRHVLDLRGGHAGRIGRHRRDDVVGEHPPGRTLRQPERRKGR